MSASKSQEFHMFKGRQIFVNKVANIKKIEQIKVQKNYLLTLSFAGYTTHQLPIIINVMDFSATLLMFQKAG